MNKAKRAVWRLSVAPQIILLYILLWVIDLSLFGLLTAVGDPAEENIGDGVRYVNTFFGMFIANIPQLIINYFLLQLNTLRQLPIYKKDVVKKCFDTCVFGTMAAFIPRLVLFTAALVMCIVSGICNIYDSIAFSSLYKIIAYLLTTVIVCCCGVFTSCIILLNNKKSTQIAWYFYPVSMIIFGVFAALKSNIDVDIALSEGIKPMVISAVICAVLSTAALTVRKITAERFE